MAATKKPQGLGMSPNPKHPAVCSTVCASHVGNPQEKKEQFTCRFGDSGIQERAISYLKGKAKVFPIELSRAIGIHRNTACKLCISMWSLKKLLRDGRTYTWNPIDAAAADRIYHARVIDLLELLDGAIRRGGRHNRGLANAYAGGEIDSCFDKREWTDTLQKVRTRLRNCLKVQNPILLLDIEREIALDIPSWAGDVYKRSQYAQQELTAERRMAYAARKRRKVDEAFFAIRQAKVAARQAAARAARAEADRLVQAQAEALVVRMGAATDQGKLGIAMQLIQLVGPEKAQRFLPGETA